MSTQQFRLIFRHISSTLIISVTVLLLVFGMLYITKKVLNSISQQRDLNVQIADLKAKSENVLSGKTISTTDVDQFSDMLSQILPDNEDFFSILLSLENLSFQTGYTITKYQIDPSQLSNEKVSLQVTGFGDTQAFLDFVRNYLFSGGRFATSDLVKYNEDTSQGSTIGLTFYTHKTASISQENRTLSPQDIALLKDIQNKTQIIVKSPGDGSTVYTTKPDPFSEQPSSVEAVKPVEPIASPTP